MDAKKEAFIYSGMCGGLGVSTNITGPTKSFAKCSTVLFSDIYCNFIYTYRPRSRCLVCLYGRYVMLPIAVCQVHDYLQDPFIGTVTCVLFPAPPSLLIAMEYDGG